MNNPYCISSTDLKELWEQKNRARLNKQVSNFENISVSEMTTQMEKDAGIFHEAMAADTAKFTAVTENVEIVTANHLSEFYFPGVDTEICFEMKTDFTTPQNISYDDLVLGIENNTYIDCSIRSDERHFNFQIKRYSQKHFSFTNKAMSEYIENVAKGYGDMNGTILIVVLQPDKEPKDKFDFKEIHDYFSTKKDKISFDEIDFIFNDENQQMIWWQVFPQFGLAKKPLIFKSEKYQKLQEEIKNKLQDN